MYQNIYITDWEPGSPPRVFIWDDEQGLVKKLFREFEYAYQRAANGKYTSIYGEPLAKIVGRTKDIPGLYESDVSRETRVLTDLYLHSDEPSKNHRTLFFDIEVETDGTSPDMMRADKAITAMSMHYKEKDEYRVWILDPDMKLDSQVRENIHIVSCRTELELIEGFLDYYTDVKPTIISGWNSDFFDIPYIIRRLENRYGKPYAQMLSPIKMYKFSEHRQRYVIAGVTSLDYMNVYKKFASSQKPSYRLDAISKDEVGVGKIEYEGTLDDLYANDIEKFLEYSIHDVRLLRMLDDKLRYLELIRAICHMGHVPYEDYAYSSRFIEGTILTFLHRKGIIAPNKPAGGAEAFAQKLEDDTEGFVGAFVKPPKPEVYPWVYSLDLQSLYPSIIMSLNISPETKMGIVRNWNLDAYNKKQLLEIEVDGKDGRTVMSPEAFADWIETNQYAISSNGILYRQDAVGIIPEILDKWFAARAEFKGLMKKYTKEGNRELADYYDRRQYAQKILLNSIYGVLGLSIFRFYDLDNALAVTSVGQDVIKTTAKFVNMQYKKRNVPNKTQEWMDSYQQWLTLWKEKTVPSPDDHCVYIDTDSVYFSAEPFLSDGMTFEERKAETIRIAYEFEEGINKFYTPMAKKLFNCLNHRFVIKGESVMQTAFWMRKKRYAMLKVYDLETKQDIDFKVAVKGLDVVRSSFPPAFQKFMKGILRNILDRQPKEYVDEEILKFRRDMLSLTYMDVAKNTSVKNITKYLKDMPPEAKYDYTVFVSGTPAHVKAAMTYNRMLEHFGIHHQYTPIRDGDKIKWVKLKKNPLGIATLALKTYDDPPQLVEIVEQYMDYERLYEDELENKLADFYTALGWGKLPVPVNTNVSSIFAYED